MHTSHQRHRTTAAALFLAAIAAVACGGPSGPSWVDQARASDVPPSNGGSDAGSDAGTAPGCELAPDASIEPGGKSGGGSSGARKVTPGSRNDPYGATGARQIPGPNIVIAPIPSAPVSIVVARPADPDEHVAARQPDGKVSGPVPDPKVIGAAASPEMGTPPDASTDPETLAPCEGGAL